MPSVAGEEKFGTRKKRRVLSTTGTGQQSQGLQSGTLVKDVVAGTHKYSRYTVWFNINEFFCIKRLPL